MFLNYELDSLLSLTKYPNPSNVHVSCMTGQIEAIEGLLLSHLQSSNVPGTSFLIPFLHFSSNSQSKMNQRENGRYLAEISVISLRTCVEIPTISS